MNNEPVAWLIQAKIWHEFTFSKPAEDSEDVVITALYTHPEKTLTDEEIKAIANNLTCTPDKNWNVLFAKAILKKASEK